MSLSLAWTACSSGTQVAADAGCPVPCANVCCAGGAQCVAGSCIGPNSSDAGRNAGRDAEAGPLPDGGQNSSWDQMQWDWGTWR
jgi:hypothetical protein